MTDTMNTPNIPKEINMLKLSLLVAVAGLTLAGCSSTPSPAVGSDYVANGYTLTSKRDKPRIRPPGALKKLCTYTKGDTTHSILVLRTQTCVK